MALADLSSSVTTLSNGVHMPLLGLGVWRMDEGPEVEQSVSWALEAGYRSIDTAKVYGNETGVGKAIAGSGLPREDLFVTTKVWNSDQGYDRTMRAFEDSLVRLGLEYVDLYLVHWPVKTRYIDTWRALETLYEEGRVRAIGVSNFMIHHLEDLLANAKVDPVVNQYEYHPRLQQPELHTYCLKHNIQPEAWSPIMKGRVVEIPELEEIGGRHQKSAVQVTLRWLLQKNVVAIPKSSKRQRIIDNGDLFDFELSEEEMTAIDALDRDQRVGPDPDNFDF